MTKLLNLDELPTKIDKTIVLNGKRHALQPMSVGEFIAQQKLAEKMEKASNMTGLIEQVIDIVNKAFPTIERSELEALTFEKLNAIFEFLSAENQPQEGDVKGE